MSIASTVVGCIVLYISSSLCSSAGLGGGTLNVPILINLFGFDFSTATILSLCTLMGNYLFQFLINLDKRHPTSSTKPLIYWDAVLVLLPAELGGANIGIILSAILPNTILYFLAVIVLIIAGGLTLNKGLHLYEIESAAFSEKQTLLPLMSGNSHGNSAGSNANYGSDGTKIDVVFNSSTGHGDDDELVMEHNSEESILLSIIPPYLCCYLLHDKRKGKLSRIADSNRGFASSSDDDDGPIDITDTLPINMPWLVIQVVLGVWFLYAICYVVMNEFTTCSAGYYIVLGVIYPLLVIEVIWGMRYLRTEQIEVPESVAEGDILWNGVSSHMPVIAFFVGILTTLLGIGGGELMGPLLLMAKVLPTVSSATTSIMSLLNSSSNILHYIVLGQVPFDYAIMVFLIGSAGGLTGRIAGLFVAQKYGRSSFLIFTLVAVICVSFFIYVSYIFTHDVDVSFGSLCN